MIVTPGKRSSASSSGCRRITRRPNKELKLTKPSIMELRSLTPVFAPYSWDPRLTAAGWSGSLLA
jgi:hypothetical protein